jgi:hypothetical protein
LEIRILLSELRKKIGTQSLLGIVDAFDFSVYQLGGFWKLGKETLQVALPQTFGKHF